VEPRKRTKRGAVKRRQGRGRVAAGQKNIWLCIIYLDPCARYIRLRRRFHIESEREQTCICVCVHVARWYISIYQGIVYATQAWRNLFLSLSLSFSLYVCEGSLRTQAKL